MAGQVDIFLSREYVSISLLRPNLLEESAWKPADRTFFGGLISIMDVPADAAPPYFLGLVHALHRSLLRVVGLQAGQVFQRRHNRYIVIQCVSPDDEPLNLGCPFVNG